MFERIPVPTPFEVGRVNAYVAGKTVIDPGPDSEKAWSTLVDGLEECGLEPEDVEQVVITHPHLDHFGLGKRFRDLGATIVASPEAAAVMADYPARLDKEQAFFAPFFERCGVDPELAETVVTLPDPFLTYASSFETDREVTAGDTVSVAGQSLAVGRAGGHAPGELTFAYESEGEQRAIVGDTVLGHITPNPFLQPPAEEGGERPQSLIRFKDALERLADADYDRLLPGHSDPIEDPNGRIDEIQEATEERTENVREIVDGPTQPIEVMEGLFGDMPLTETFSGMSEAVGHLDVLEARGEVVCEDGEDELIYRES